MSSGIPVAESDVLIVGAGIVGLAHAAAALDRGWRVTVIDRDRRAVGASIRNFGHCCVTAQSGELLELALLARERWLRASAEAGFFAIESGALVVARSATEDAVLDELAELRGDDAVTRLSASQVQDRLGSEGGEATSGALLPADIRVDPREAVAGVARWLESRGARFLWGTSYLGRDGELARTSRGDVRADRVIVCVGHDLDYLHPEAAEQHGIERCALQMALLAAPHAHPVAEAVLSGTSMLRYPAFVETSASTALREEIGAQRPDLIGIDANVMFTQRPDGTILAGDSHRLAPTMDPFLDEPTSSTLVAEIGSILGRRDLRVLQRWQGIYAASPVAPYLVSSQGDGVTAVSVTSGVGMTISFGLAMRVIDGLG
jgi:FAD dependent oxidoreductase TIGR03364